MGEPCYYLIKEVLTPCTKADLKNATAQYVAVVTKECWLLERDSFDLGIDLELEMSEVLTTRAEVNYDSLTGTFCIPNRKDFSRSDFSFVFALDEKGIVFIDDSGTAESMVRAMCNNRKWRFPGLERFLYDFLDQIIQQDARILEDYERELDQMELHILEEINDVSSGRISEIRGDIRDLGIHYEQLMDLGEVLVENENHFFEPENLRYFHLFINRIARLRDTVNSVRDYTMQIRDLYKTHLDIKQNRIMTLLTVVTAIFMPLTLIVGWYGMNFRYMPELEYRYSYPVVIVVCIAIVAVLLLLFKKKKWL